MHAGDAAEGEDVPHFSEEEEETMSQTGRPMTDQEMKELGLSPPQDVEDVEVEESEEEEGGDGGWHCRAVLPEVRCDEATPMPKADAPNGGAHAATRTCWATAEACRAPGCCATTPTGTAWCDGAPVDPVHQDHGGPAAAATAATACSCTQQQKQQQQQAMRGGGAI